MNELIVAEALLDGATMNAIASRYLSGVLTGVLNAQAVFEHLEWE
ncbi:hypothetical protein [Pelagimonas varians]|nr:hypothetical protein [Pelagimonas varians]